MKKHLIFVAMAVFVIPSVAFASWWNPFSWGIFHKTDTKTQVLEKRIVELEKKLSNTKIATTSVLTKPSTAKKATKVLSAPQSKAPTKTQSNSVPDIPAEWIRPDGSFYTNAELFDKRCKVKYGTYSVWDGNYCTCEAGNFFSSVSGTCVANDQVCKEKYGGYSIWDGVVTNIGQPRCGCAAGYLFYGAGLACEKERANSSNYDIYNVSINSGVPYSPDQLRDIDCAWYGIGCPTIDVRIVR